MRNMYPTCDIKDVFPWKMAEFPAPDDLWRIYGQDPSFGRIKTVVGGRIELAMLAAEKYEGQAPTSMLMNSFSIY